jgi:hypothetical protein
MKRRSMIKQLLTCLLILFIAAPPTAMGQKTSASTQAAPATDTGQNTGGSSQKPFTEEQLAQMVSPIALYPDSLVSQILMASTYPLEVVQAARWAKANKELKGDALAKALEAQPWDPSVKSLVNFPPVLELMDEKLDWTTKLGDAFLAQPKDVMGSVQKLRAKAEAEGNLKTTPEQKVIVEKETQTIIIESADPEVIYVPTYNPTVVYGAWPYPAYPPYYYYPPAYAPPPYAAAYSFAAGVAVGVAWGYAWGGCNWHGGDIDIDINRNSNINRNIDRGKYAQQRPARGEGGKGSWQHNPQHRQGAAYRDQGTSQRFGQSQARTAGTQQAARGYAERGSSGSRQGTQGQDLSSGGGFDRGGTGSRESVGGLSSSRELSAQKGGSAFGGSGSGKSERMASQRGSTSRSSFGGGSRGGGGRGGGSRGGGGRR